MPSVVYRKSSAFALEIGALNAVLTHHPEKISIFNRLFPRLMRKEVVNRQLLKEQLYTSRILPFPVKKATIVDPELVIEEVVREHNS